MVLSQSANLPNLPLQIHLCQALDGLIARGVSFAAFREPGNRPVLVFQRDGCFHSFHDMTEISGEGFLLAPFAVSPSLPILFLRPEQKACGWTEMARLLSNTGVTNGGNSHDSGSLTQPSIDQKSEVAFFSKQFTRLGCPSPSAPVEACSELPHDQAPSPSYRKTLSLFLSHLKTGRFHKLVLSRTENIAVSCSAAQVFFAACELYTDAMVSLCHTPISGTWLGATPEILLQGEGKSWKTMALAGTRPAGTRSDWDAKNIREQALVADYIRERLYVCCRDIEMKGPFTSRAGRVEHLRTDFFFSPRHAAAAAELVGSLHPTPAVCGLPKDEAFRFIQHAEKHNRRYYSGFLGWWGSGSVSLYVNLRCMEMSTQQVTLHAGGGILPTSNVNDEWTETCQKMRTMLSLLKYGAQ